MNFAHSVKNCLLAFLTILMFHFIIQNTIVDEIEKTLNIIKEQGITTVIVEQNAIRALKLADRAVILDTGTVVFDGTAQEVLENDALRAEYLAI